MIQKIAGKNFQGYKEFEMEFHPGVNVVIGKSDAGKSAAFRLIEWVRANRPLGDAFRSEWGGTTEGQIWTTDDQTVKRVKGEAENSYQINSAKPLKAFGQNPPEGINQVLMLDEINVQNQNETPFLLGKPLWSPGEVARVLNQAASLEDIDTATRNLTKGYRTSLRQIESNEKALEDHEQELKKYQNLPELEELITELEHLERHRNILSGQRNALYNLWQDITHIKVCLEKTIDVRPAEGLLSKAEKINQKRGKLVEEFNRLNELYEEIDSVSVRKNRAETLTKKLQKEYDDLAPDECPLCGGPMK